MPLRRRLWPALLLGSLLLPACDDESECIRNCDRRFPQDGAARAACQLDCMERRLESCRAEPGSCDRWPSQPEDDRTDRNR